MATIALVEDNENIQIELITFFTEQGYDIVCIDCHAPLDPLKQLIMDQKLQIILLDINLCEISGFEICKQIRTYSQVPILFVTCRDSDMDEIKALHLGGDDYIRKPYHLPVLLAKVERMVKRNQMDSNKLYMEDICLEVAKSQIVTQKGCIELSKNEMKILYYLFQNQDRVVSKDQLIEYLWENKLYVDENILNVNLSRMRKRLSEIGLTDFIKTVPKAGYTLQKQQDV